MKQLAKRKQPMIVVTHEMSFAREVADRAIFTEGGGTVEQGDPQKIFSAP